MAPMSLSGHVLAPDFCFKDRQLTHQIFVEGRIFLRVIHHGLSLASRPGKIGINRSIGVTG